MSRRRRVVIRVAISIASALFMAAIFASMGDAGALVAHSGSVAIEARPTSRVVDGQVLAIRAVSATGVEIYQLRAHLCSAGAPVRTNFDFGFQGRRCANVALGHGDVEQTVEYGNGVNAGALNTFKVGVGNVRWVNELGFDQLLHCGPGFPCDLVVRVQITNDTLFFTVPLCYGGGCPAEPADGAVIPEPTTTSTTVHPPAPISAPARTVAPAAPIAGSSPPHSGSTPDRAVHAGSVPVKSSKSARASGPLCVPKPLTASTASTASTVRRGLSQNARVAIAALAGAIGSAWIVSIFLRGSALLVPLLARRRRLHARGTFSMINDYETKESVR